MKYRKLGRSGVLVSELALGTMIFGESSPRATDEATALRMIDRFLDAGGNHIDTANVYADGRSEEIVGKAMKGRRDKIFLATKVHFRKGPGPNDIGLSRVHIMREVENSLRRLQTDYIDLYYAHCWDEVTPIEEMLRAFDDLVTAGKVRYIGVSNFHAWQIMKSLAISDAHGWVRFVAAQMQYSLVVRDIEYEFTPLALDQGVGLVPWSPLGGGFLSGKYRRGERPTSGRLAYLGDESESSWRRRAVERNWQIIDAVGEIAEERGKTYAQVALAWLRAQPGVVSIVIGARTEEQLEDNLGSVGWDLTGDELDRLNRVSAPPDMYPYRMIKQYGRRMPV